MKIIYLGTPDFALPGLERLAEGETEVAAVVTRPDRPAGRGRRPTPPPVKIRAGELGIPVLQPSALAGEEFLDAVREINPDLFVVSAYGRFIPAGLLDLAPRGGINLHPSLLPRYRGAAPIQWALINGEEETGVTVISVAERMDAGDIWARRAVPVAPDDDAPALSSKLARVGGELLAEVVEKMEREVISPRPQDESLATLAPRLTKEDGHIDWGRPAEEIANRVRGLRPWPGTYTFLPDGRTLKIISAEPAEGGGEPGEVIRAEDDDMVIAAGKGALRVRELQLEGKRPLPTGAFLRGAPLRSGEILGRPPGRDGR